MEKYHIELTDEEQALVDEIDFESYTHKSFLANQQPILALLSSLRDRAAIPKQRLKYWKNPEYNTSRRGKISHLEQFEKNGNVGNEDEVYMHPEFLKSYLGYFLYGADLPDKLIQMFEMGLEEKHIRPEWFTSGDYAPTWKIARKVARIAIREHDLDKSSVAEEFLRLCLDMELDIHVALTVRDQVMKIHNRTDHRNTTASRYR